MRWPVFSKIRPASVSTTCITADFSPAAIDDLRAYSWPGNVRELQAEVQRFCRDLFRMKAAIFCKHFSAENLSIMTGIQVTPEVEAIIR